MSKVLAKDAPKGKYKSIKGRVIELHPKVSPKKFPLKNVKDGIPYRFKDGKDGWVYSYLPPNYELKKED